MVGNATSGRPTRWKRRIGIGVAVMAAVVAAVPLIWGAWAEHQLAAELARLRAAGEPVSAADLPVDTLADGDNASLDYAAAGKAIDEKRPAWHRWDEAEPGEFDLPLTADGRETLRQIVADNGQALARVAAARGKAAGSWHDPFGRPYLTAAGQFDLDASRRAANLLSLAAKSAHAQGNDGAAVADALDLCRLADAAEHRPTYIGHLVATGIWSLAARTADAVAPDLGVGGPRGATRADVDRWVARLLDGRAAAAGQRLGWQTERIAIVDTVADLGTVRSVQGYFVRPFVLTDSRLVCDALEDEIAAGQAADLPTARGLRAASAADREISAHPKRHLLASLFMVGGTKGGVADFMGTAERRLAAVALACRLYRLDHDGHLPPALADLTPAYLPAVPLDPMTGHPFVYRRGGADPVVYSMGENGVDNGGVERDPKRAYSAQKSLDDIVVHLLRHPRPATEPTDPLPPGMR